MGLLPDPADFAPDAVVDAGDTAVDLAWSGHKGDEVDILGPSTNYLFGDGVDSSVEDEVSARDPKTGEWLGFTNTRQLPSGESAQEEDGKSPNPSSGNALVWGLVALLVIYVFGQLFDYQIGGASG